jgi:protein-tyrosine phosphatase
MSGMTTSGFVDLHAHVVPGVDDGPRNLAEALALMRALAGLGFGIVCATPHQKAGAFEATETDIRTASDDLRRACAIDLPEVQILRGAENYWDEWFFARTQDLSVPAYEGRRALLVELPFGQVPPRLEEVLFDLRMRGVLPVLAHPERTPGLMRDETRCVRVAQVAALVVDLAALGGLFGTGPARHLVSSGLARAVASDIHQVSDSEMIARGMEWIERKLGAAALERLLVQHPRRILRGELPES